MTAPATATVTGTFPAAVQANPVYFVPSAAVVFDGSPELLPSSPVSAKVASGALTALDGTPLELPKTDAGVPVGPTGFWFWTCKGLPGVDAFSFFLTADSDITDLINSPASGGGGGGAVASVNGQTGTVVLDAADVDAVPAPATVSPAPSKYSPLLYGAVWGWPWEFHPDASGAKEDGKVIGDVVTNATTVITSASAGFTSADVGKHIMIHGANGPANGPLITVITSVTNATTAVLASPAGASATGCPAVYGTDDTAAINDAMDRARTYALARGGLAKLRLAPAIYVSATLTQQSGAGLATYNTQIPLPVADLDGSGQKLVVELEGEGDAGYTQFWNSLIPNVGGCTAIVSMLTAPPADDGTYGKQSVIGAPTGGSTDAATHGFYNMKASAKGIMVVSPLGTNLCAWDFGFAGGMRWEKCSAHVFAPVGVNASAVQPWSKDIGSSGLIGSTHGIGLRSPLDGNNDDATADDCAVSGYNLSYQLADHFSAGRLASINSDVALKIDGAAGASGLNHRISIRQMSAENYNGGILTVGTSPGTLVPVDIMWDAECNAVVYDFRDDGNMLRGIIRFTDPADQGRGMTVVGATGVQVVNDNNPAA